MISIQALPDTVHLHKDQWKTIGIRILDYYGCSTTASEIGRCIDQWKRDHRVPEGEMIDGLGFLFGDLLIDQHGGRWVWVVDGFGQTPAVEREPGGYISYVLDSVSKRLRDDSVAEREMATLADTYADLDK